MRPWNNWIHCTGSTYGAWLRGDPRGWRARGHREHVDGDYRNPPPSGAFDALHAQSERLMKRPVVTLSWDARVAACRKTVDALRYHEVQVADLCVGARHWHALARFVPLDRESWFIIEMEGDTDRDPRRLMGIAKKESARELSRQHLAAPGGVWAGGCGRRFIKNEWHYDTVRKYIPDHAKQGAAVYSLLVGRS
jgi:hypothetical protein